MARRPRHSSQSPTPGTQRLGAPELDQLAADQRKIRTRF
jgi:hypothetical protein